MSNILTSACQFTAKVLIAVIMLSAPGECIFALDSSSDVSIPINGRYGDNDDRFIVNDPALYAAALRDGIRCLDAGCEEEIMRQLPYMLDEELRDFLTGLYLSEKDDPFYFNDVENKLKGLKALEIFFRHHHFEKAADYVSNRLKIPLKNICTGLLYRPEDGTYLYCDIEVPGNHCEKHCLDDGLLKQISSMSDLDKKLTLMAAINDEDSSIQNATMGVCKVKNIAYIAPKEEVRNSQEENLNLCGILNANSVITAFAGRGNRFVGGVQSAPTEYTCSYVNLSIDKTGPIWKASSDRSNDNYVIQRDGHTHYHLKPEDFRAIQEAVQQAAPQKFKNRTTSHQRL